MSSMNITLSFQEGFDDFRAVKPFTLLRDKVLPVLEERRADLDAMYNSVMGRPEVDPVLLTGVTILQMMQGASDRVAVELCCYDVRWRVALGLPSDWEPFHPTTLVYFRQRMAEHECSRLVMDAGIEAMTRDDYIKKSGAVRIDSTHVFAAISAMSRLACVRETIRFALNFLTKLTNVDDWEPWYSRYGERNPKELRKASKETLKATMAQAGKDAFDVLNKVTEQIKVASEAEPVALLQRVFNEQFEIADDGEVDQRKSTDSGAVKNPNDPDAHWSTKGATGKEGWVGYKLQVCETAPSETCSKGEPTSAVITSVVTQSAETSDHGSLKPVLDEHLSNGQEAPVEIFADAGYISAGDLKQAADNNYDLTGPVAGPPHRSGLYGADLFSVDIPTRKAVCPAGITSSSCSRIHEGGRDKTVYYFEWPEDVCAACKLKDKCLSKKKKRKRRSLEVGADHMFIQERRILCKTPEYIELMKRRNAVEGTHSELKRGYGIRRGRYKGLAKTAIQHQFTAAACNLRRWAARLCWLANKTA